jgi:hypothetical protein
MPLELQDLASLDPTAVADNVSLMAELLAGSVPDADLRPGGVLYGTVVTRAAELHTLNQSNWNRVADSNSLLALENDPTLADGDAVDRVASNYLITRQSGTIATGTVVLVMDSNSLLLIPSSMAFTVGTTSFHPVTSFTGVSSSDEVTTDADRVFALRADGSTYALLVDVAADAVGSAGNVSLGTTFSPSSTLPGLISAYAAGDFLGGSDSETTSQLITRLSQGITTPSLSSRAGATALIKASFPSVSDVSIIGSGDPEMNRATAGPFKRPGAADVYVRTRQRPLRLTVTKTATLLDVGAATWSIAFGRDEYPGMYEVISILPVGSNAGGTLTITADLRTFDSDVVDGADQVPAASPTQAEYSRYQAGTLTFVDTAVGALGAGDTRDYDVTIRYMPLIGTISDWVMSRDRLPPGTDYLVKAPIPCVVDLELRVVAGRGDAAVDPVALASAAANAVNSVDFATGKLTASTIINAVQSLLPRRTRLELPVGLRGRIRAPGGEMLWIFDNDGLTIPDRPELSVSSRTVAFYLDPVDIVVDVLASDAKPV